MPQDGTKSVVYRSFFSCDDPKGVAEYKTSMKSKAVSQKPDNKVDRQRKQKNLDISFPHDEDRKDIVPKGPTDEFDNLSSVQLMEVSKGAHKLNQVIDTWSKSLSFDTQSKDIAKDLLKGALDLQESLTMLGKLQEASKYMVKSKKKHKEKANKGKLEGVGIERTTSDRFVIERTTSDRFGYHNKMDFQKPRLSADGSSRDCYEELREVIRESFARQNLLPKSSAEEKGSFDRIKSYSEERACSDRKESYKEEKGYFESKRLDLSLDYPSTSSSQSSTFHSHEFDSFDSSLSKSQEQKPKGPNVIARLMGLEEIPSRPSQSTMQKEDKQLNHVRPIFDTHLPKSRKPHCSFQKVDPQRRMVEDRLETEEFQRLVSNKSIDGAKHHKYLSNVFDRRKGLADDAPPIVIMKPLHLSCSFEEELQKQKHRRGDLYGKEIISKWKMEKAVPPQKSSDRRGALNFSDIQGKLLAEMSPLKRLSKAKGEKDLGDACKKSDDRVIKVQENQSSTKIKASATVKPKVQKKEVMENKVEKIQRMAPTKREPLEVDIAKSKDASKLQNVNKSSSANLTKPEREHKLSKTRVSQRNSAPSNLTLQCGTLAASRSSNIQKKNAKKEKQVSILPSTLEVERQYRNDDTEIEARYEDKHEVTVTKMTSPEQFPTNAVQSSLNLDNGKNSESCFCDSTKLVIHDKTDIESIGDSISSISTEKRICKTGDTTRDMLLGHSSFLNQAEELFHFNVYQPVMLKTMNLHEDGVPDSKLLLDCAKELLEHKSLQCALAANPLTHITFEQSKLFISLEQLVGEICEGIEDLQSCHKLSAGTLTVDTLYLTLQKDIWGKGVASGSWDLGWRYGFSLNEIEPVVIDIEQIVFNGIIEDLLTDLRVSSFPTIG